MPIFQRIHSLDTMFNQLSEPAIIINDIVNTSDEDRERIKELVTTRYSSDMISLLPSCRCGITKGEFSVTEHCRYCLSPIKSSMETDIEPSVWFRKPDGVAPILIPCMWDMLKDRFKKSGFNIISWLTDTTYRPNVKQPAVVNKIIEAGIQRGYNNFYENFDVIMALLFSLKDLKDAKSKDVDYLKELIAQERHNLFSNYIPLPNKSILVVEKTNVGVYVDPIIVDAVDAIEMLVSIDKSFHDQSTKVKENRTAKAMSQYSDFLRAFYKTNLSPKAGLIRRHVTGTRTNFSTRGVITSLTGTHNYRKVELPWGMGLTAFRPLLLNKLDKLGMDLNSSIGLLLGHIEKFHPLLNSLLEEIIAEAPEGSIEICLQRNDDKLTTFAGYLH